MSGLAFLNITPGYEKATGRIIMRTVNDWGKVLYKKCSHFNGLPIGIMKI